MSVWLTRDAEDDGKVRKLVDIWRSKPVRITEGYGDGCEWLDLDGDSVDGLIDFLPMRECVEQFGTAPDHDKMIIKVGGISVERVLARIESKQRKKEK